MKSPVLSMHAQLSLDPLPPFRNTFLVLPVKCPVIPLSLLTALPSQKTAGSGGPSSQVWYAQYFWHFYIQLCCTQQQHNISTGTSLKVAHLFHFCKRPSELGLLIFQYGGGEKVPLVCSLHG